jgi:hypothetical protein|nr:hypothetical protein [Oxalobacteraceae bacterium]
MTQWGAVILIAALQGCALLPSAFDSQEHARLITINQLSADNRVCGDRASALDTAKDITRQADWVHRYGASLGDNQNMTRMHANLLAMSRELSDRLAQGEVSVVYCRSKLDNINRASKTMIDVSARRPRI